MAGLIIFVVFFQLMALANGSEILAPDNFWGFLIYCREKRGKQTFYYAREITICFPKGTCIN